MSEIVIGGLGPGSKDLVSDAVHQLARTHTTFLRTRKHPSANAFAELDSFDHLYESQQSVVEVYEAITEQLVLEAIDRGKIGYLVPGSPLIAERTVDLLRQRQEVSIEVLPGISFLDLAWERLHVDPVGRGVTIVDGQNLESGFASLTGPLLVAQCDNRFVLSDIKLSLEFENPPKVTVLQRLGLNDEAIFEVEWENLDREFEPDHLTSLWIPDLPLSGPVGSMGELYALVRRLRSACPWDRDQTPSSLIPGLLEEANEVVEAIELIESDAGSLDDLIEELGDLLFHIMMQGAIGEEGETFDMGDVARGIRDKMIRRHPHIFDRDPGMPMPSKEQLAKQWTAIKAAEGAQAKNNLGNRGSR